MSDKMNRRAEPPRSLDGKCPMCGSSRSVAAFDVMDKDSKYRRCEDCALLYVRDFMRPMGAGSVVRGNPRGVDREDALRVGVTFQWVTPESAARGDYEDAGWERDKEAMSFREAAEVVRNWLPYDSGSPQWNGRDALIFPGVQEHRDPKDGSVTTYDVIVEGDAVTLRRLEQWYHALVAGRTRLKPYRQNAAGGRREARPYVGLVRGRANEREAFRSAVTPTASTHPRYGAVVGPFRTMRAAKLAAMAQMQGMARNVAEWERFAERREGQHQLALGAMKALSEPRVNGAKMKVPVYDYASARRALDQHGRNLGHNTTINDGPSSGAIEVWLYSTCIVTYYPDGTVRLHSGGHRTVTTLSRINELLPPYLSVRSDGRGGWVVLEGVPRGAKPTAAQVKAGQPFFDGMRIGVR